MRRITMQDVADFLPLLLLTGGDGPPPSGGGVGVITTDRRGFLRDGRPWVWAGHTGFPLCDLFRRGEVGLLDDILGDHEGLPVVRTWDYADWGADAWDSAPPDVWVGYLAHLRSRGRYCSLTLLTSDERRRIAPAIALVQAITAAGCDNVFFEGGNEPRTHKDIDTHALVAVMEASGRPWCTGDYEESSRWRGTHGLYHPARTFDFARRAHDAMEYYNGGGPNSPADPACPVPWVNDEPGKIEDVGTDWRAWLSHFVASYLLGGGFTVHTQTGKFGRRPTPDERMLIATARQALAMFPAEAVNESYRRLVEPGQPDHARTYVLGERYMVRCQQAQVPVSEPGWTPLDDGLVCYQR